MKVAEGVRPDDFDVAPDGSIYLSSGMALYRISRAGEITKMIDNVPNGAAAVVSADGKWVYWPTRGGSMPQRLLRAARSSKSERASGARQPVMMGSAGNKYG